jgi:hypothetical protein
MSNSDLFYIPSLIFKSFTKNGRYITRREIMHLGKTGIKTFSLLTIALISACSYSQSIISPVSENKVVTETIKSNTLLKGLVEFPPEKLFKVKLADPYGIALQTTVSIIRPADNVTVATGLTNASGVFQINPDSSFNPADGDIFILEAAKRGAPAHQELKTMRTLIKWVAAGNGSWQSITTPDVRINVMTTTLSIISANDSVVTPASLINKLPIISDVVTFSPFGTVTQPIFDRVQAQVSGVLEQNADPLQYIQLINNIYVVKNPTDVSVSLPGDPAAGNLIFGIQTVNTPNLASINIMGIDGTNRQELLSAANGNNLNHSIIGVSGNNKVIYIDTTNNNSLGYTLKLMNVDGSNKSTVFTPPNAPAQCTPGSTATLSLSDNFDEIASANKNKVLFSAYDGNFLSIYLLNTIDYSVTQVATTIDSYCSVNNVVSLSEDGNKAVYQQYTGTGSLFVKNIIENTEIEIPEARGLGHILSNNDKIVFTHAYYFDPSFNGLLFIQDLNSGNPAVDIGQPLRNAGYLFNSINRASITPDGTKIIAFVTGGGSGAAILILNSADGNIIYTYPISPSIGLAPNTPKFFSNNSKVLMRSNNGTFNIPVVIDLNTGVLTDLSLPITNHFTCGTPFISPNEETISFNCPVQGTTSSFNDVYVASTNNLRYPINITNTPSINEIKSRFVF